MDCGELDLKVLPIAGTAMGKEKLSWPGVCLTNNPALITLAGPTGYIFFDKDVDVSMISAIASGVPAVIATGFFILSSGTE
jgi:hypothetical protein